VSGELGRPERDIDLAIPLYTLLKERVLVTGASGALGQPLVALLRESGVHVVPTDIDLQGGAPWGTRYMDVTAFQSVLEGLAFHEPTLVINLAAAKLAPEGEENPWAAVDVNVNGVQNLLNAARSARVVQASTCKAGTRYCSYGFSKALAERLVLNAGGTVTRFYNVPSAGPSVLTIWRGLDADEPLPVAPCRRYLISEREALASLLWSCVLPPGRYAVDPGEPSTMAEYAERLFPGRMQVEMPPRRGDSDEELLHAPFEWVEETPVPFINRIGSPNDV